MGNICSASDVKSKRGAKGDGKAKKRKAASPTPRGGTRPSSPGTARRKQPAVAPSEQTNMNPLILIGDDGHLSVVESSDNELKTASTPAKTVVGDAFEKVHSVPSSPMNVRPGRPDAFGVEHVSEAKLRNIQGWIDIIDKKALLDPQDVNGQQRKEEARLSSPTFDSQRRSSVLDNFAEVVPKEGSVTGSMQVGEKSHSSGDAHTLWVQQSGFSGSSKQHSQRKE